MFRLKDIKERYNFNDYADVEYYYPNGEDKYYRLHNDFITSVDMIDYDYSDDNNLVLDVRELDEEEYNNTIMANSCNEISFEDWYGNKGAKVLVIVLSSENIERE